MPRRNRQKLHKELRLAAEAQQALRVQRRNRRRAEAEVRERAVVAALRGQVRPGVQVRPRDAVLNGVRNLMALARVEEDLRRRVEQICTSLGAMATSNDLTWYLLLAMPRWVRLPGSFAPPRGSVRKVRDAFALHLLARYPVPPFLLRALDTDPLAVARVPEEDAWAVHLLAHVGQGGSLRDLVGTEHLPVPLTRRMVHLFLRAPAQTRPVAALRRAQVAGFGGPGALARSLMHTRLGELRGPDPVVGEPFWHRIIGWLCGRDDVTRLGTTELNQVLAWLEVEQRQGELCLKGRTLTSVRRRASEWMAARERLAGADVLPSSGLLPLVQEPWTVVELDDARELQAEGEAMRHCAWSYRRLITKGKTALFSLRHGGERRATVEVSLGAAKVVQAKRAGNRPCDCAELGVIEAWAALNRLRVASRL